jgi:hypothetical protein
VIARPADERAQTVFQTIAEGARTEQADARGGKLYRERDTVEPPAHVLDDAFEFRAGYEPGIRLAGTFSEEGGSVGGLHARDPHDDLAAHAERLSTRGKDCDVRAAPQDSRHYLDYTAQHVLAIVEHKERPFAT